MTPIHSTRLHLTYIGGDVKSMYHAIKEKGPLIGVGHPGESSADFFRVEYEMNHMLHKSAVPQVRISQ
jgi:hypothetical protein